MMPKARSGPPKNKAKVEKTSRDVSSNSSWNQSSDFAETLWMETEKLSSKCSLILKSNCQPNKKKCKEKIFSSASSKNGSTLLMPFWK